MEIYTQLNSTLTLNGRKLLVDVCKWAYYTLPPERFEAFFQDQIDYTNQFYNLTGFSHEIIYSSGAVDRLGNKAILGMRYIFENAKITIDKYEYWQNEFSNDSRVSYRPWVKEN